MQMQLLMCRGKVAEGRTRGWRRIQRFGGNGAVIQSPGGRTIRAKNAFTRAPTSSSKGS
jgi:hypothetical protein